MLKICIVDDEKYIRDELRYFLEKYDDVEIVGEASDGEIALDIIKEKKPDGVFLDIQLQHMSGLLLARKILDLEKAPFVILATAYNEYAIQGFEINVSDYILKPFSEERIRMAIDRVKNSKKVQVLEEDQPHLKKLCVCRDNKYILMDLKDIEYMESKNNLVVVYNKNEEYSCNHTLKELEERFKNEGFIRTHKSFIVNIDYIKEIIPWFNYTYKVKIKGKETLDIPVSRNYMKKFKRVLGL